MSIKDWWAKEDEETRKRTEKLKKSGEWRDYDKDISQPHPLMWREDGKYPPGSPMNTTQLKWNQKDIDKIFRTDPQDAHIEDYNTDLQ